MSLESLWATLDERLLPVLRAYRERLPTLEISEKADRTLLSEADVAAQQLIVETVLDAFPGSGFVAEEDDELIPRQGDPMWVVDPIDGTSQFVTPSARGVLQRGLPSGRRRPHRGVLGQDLTPVPAEVLAQRAPRFAEVVVGEPECVRWFLSLLND